ncbi:F-box and associated interaction domains-containing protein [Striga asiatica]|uniref:F-box and associated interaction domains-containing protein n=1 Tax=Striga asiatica TaxID=4170 RepID=A0A5A7R6P0_STRAF|nr:F-box and associated interaction domains-containing protein [Striga asiatica]
MESSHNYLREDLLVGILARLPVQALLRLRAVCKSWKSIIASPEFCSLHLSTNHPSKILLTTRDPGQPTIANGNHIPEQRYLLLNDDEHLPADPSCLAPFDLPFQIPDLNSLNILGSINGLICLSVTPSYLCDDDAELNIPILLWNPTIRRYVYLPDPTFSYAWNSSIEFGYDATTDDYKIMVFRNTTAVPEYHIYSLNSNTWRRGNFEIGDERRLLFNSTGAFAGGKMHWLVSDEINFDEVTLDEFEELLSKTSLYSFDVAEEVFAEVGLPPSEGVLTHPVFTVVKDSLHLVEPTLGSQTYWTIWVKMEDAGGCCDVYWKKLYSVDATAVFVCFLKNGELLMDQYPTYHITGRVEDDHGALAAYDPRDGKFKDLEPLSLSQQRAFGTVHSCNHQQSLVLLDRTLIKQTAA